MGPLSSLVGLLALIAFVWAGMVFWPVSQTPDFRPPKLSLVSLGLPAWVAGAAEGAAWVTSATIVVFASFETPKRRCD